MNKYLEKIAAEIGIKLHLNKVSPAKKTVHTGLSALTGAAGGGFIGSLPGQVANHSRATLVGMGLGAAAGGIAAGVHAHRKVTRYNQFVDKLDKAQAKAKNNV